MLVTAATRSGDHSCGDVPHPVEPVDMGCEIAEVDEIFGEQRVGDGQQ